MGGKRERKSLDWYCLSGHLDSSDRLCLTTFSIHLTVAGTIAMRDYLEAATIVFLFSIADWLQSMASHKVSSFSHELLYRTLEARLQGVF